MKQYLFALLISVTLIGSVWNAAQAGGPVSDQIIAELRTDKAGIKNSQGYAVEIYTGSSLPQIATPYYTAGWIGIELKPRTGVDCGGLYACEFSQVGIFETQSGRTWFVYAEPGVQCYRGNPAWIIDGKTRGCVGDIGDLVKSTKWHTFDLQTYDTTPYWLAHVYDKNGNMYYVAKILTNDRTAYRVYTSSEQAWDSSVYPSNPYTTLDFQFFRPQRKRTNGSGTFRDWEKSNLTYSNYIHAWASDKENICPPVNPYGAIDYDTVPPQWFAGTGGNSCSISPLF